MLVGFGFRNGKIGNRKIDDFGEKKEEKKNLESFQSPGSAFQREACMA